MSEGMKFDGEKIKTELLYKDFVEQLEEIAGVLTFGANKYAPRSWQTVPNGFERYYAALIRHTNARNKGELIDPESGRSHLSHAACCLLFMMGLDSNNVTLFSDGQGGFTKVLNSELAEARERAIKNLSDKGRAF